MPHVKQNPVAGEENQLPVAGDRIPIQGHVVVEHPAPQVLLSPKEKQENTAPAEQKQEANEAELETKEKQDVKEAHVDVDREIDPEMEVEERHIDMEGKLLPIMELEPLDDGDVPGEEVSDTGLSEEEMAFREAFQEQDTVAEYVPEEEEEEEEDKVDGEEDFQEQKENHVADEQEIPELQPELTGEKNPEDIPNAMVLDEELIDPVPQQMMLLSENYFPEEEAGMEMYVRDKRAPEPFSEEPGMEDEGLPMMIGDDTYRQGK
ncbi:hypothetical protein GOODEAATRI_010069 [Goodea atripinnis]|uniref:Uncharacterized protein n=1 Tax=Goodea atripinnis TaxID=208336 RepID=A0ABV0P5E5_9TELE